MNTEYSRYKNSASVPLNLNICRRNTRINCSGGQSISLMTKRFISTVSLQKYFNKFDRSNFDRFNVVRFSCLYVLNKPRLDASVLQKFCNCWKWNKKLHIFFAIHSPNWTVLNNDQLQNGSENVIMIIWIVDILKNA